MPRTLSWLDRIVPISRTVRDSARSHYDRKDIERLFELQPRAAQQLETLIIRDRVSTFRSVHLLSTRWNQLLKHDSTCPQLRLAQCSLIAGIRAS